MINRLKGKDLTVIVTLLMGVAMFLLLPFKVNAINDVDANPTLVITYTSSSGISKYVSTVNDRTMDICGVSILTFVDNGKESGDSTLSGTLTLNFVDYTTLTQDNKTKVMTVALDSIKGSSMPAMCKNKIYNFIQSQDKSTSALVRQLSDDVNADFSDAYMMFKPFTGVVGIILGVFALAIFVTLTLMIVIDLSYIVIPAVQEFLTSANGKPKFVSNEAWYAVKESAESNGQKNSLTLYFKHKVFQFSMLSICILYLLSGKIYLMIGSLMDMFSGILQ